MAQPRHRAYKLEGRAVEFVRGPMGVVDEDAAVEGVGAWWAQAIFWLPVAGTFLLALTYVGYKWGFYWVLREDHPIEWAQFGFLVVASLVAVVAAVRFAVQGRWWLAVLLLLVAFTAFMMAGEEISWGQRVFGWKTPADLARDNRQGETNFHNIDTGLPIAADQLSDYIELLMGLGGLALGLLTRPLRSRLHRTLIWELAPPLFAVPGFGFMALYQAFMIVSQTIAAPAILYQEWMEFCFYSSIATTVIYIYVRAARGRVVVESSPDGGVRRLNPRAPVGWVPIVAVAVVVLLITIIFAVLSTFTGIMPGNVPGSLSS